MAACCHCFFSMLQKKKMATMCRCLLLWCYYNEKGDDSKLVSPFSLCLRRQQCTNALSFFSMVVFQQKRRQQFATIVFFFGGVEVKKAMEA